MKKIKEFFADMTETVSVTKLDGTLIVAIAALSGVIIGMLISPRKNAKYGCGNGTTYITNNGERAACCWSLFYPDCLRWKPRRGICLRPSVCRLA